MKQENDIARKIIQDIHRMNSTYLINQYTTTKEKLRDDLADLKNIQNEMDLLNNKTDKNSNAKFKLLQTDWNYSNDCIIKHKTYLKGLKTIYFKLFKMDIVFGIEYKNVYGQGYKNVG